MPRARGVALVLTAAVALAAAGCGGGDSSSSSGSGSSGATQSTQTQSTQSTQTQSGGSGQSADAGGKAVFTQNCGGCHTLSDAGTSGSVGPDLDQLQPEKGTVQRQVENGGGNMPAFKDRLTPQQINQVATYVASVAGQ
jgi:mono/diheme cytochrome c family protein